ncbi:SDR family NAD(P)-dependent oxidoreductase [Desulfospira joergensenii]|uniref:SDR family NAD(P)-dependent oxidoreductase n=1 Tax=Desulfospira joergensenii TaxID=53329 RepID=UPI0003B63589|nr:SDR family NAD(P)-dependent oxidoreductase [Desulfospira joergensenii]
MIRLRESIRVRKEIRQVFTYLSDFSHIQEWDPAVVSSRMTRPGEISIGSGFDLTLKFGPFRPKMTYEIVEYEQFSKVVLKGRGSSFSAVDTILFQKTAVGTQIDYQADIRFYGTGCYIEGVLSPAMKQMGRKAMAGLERTLGDAGVFADRKSWFQSGSGLPDYLADHAVLPGMLMFSRYGYRLSRRFWKAPSGTLYGKKVVLTGGTSGIGKAAAFKLAEKKAFLTIIARNPEKAEQVKREIVQKTGNPHVDVLIADLSLMQDIRDAAARLKASKKVIDILINNAGALFNERKLTSEGLEQTFATDLLGVFYLTELLKKRLAGSSGSRIINVSSGGMYTQKIDVEDLQNAQKTYSGAKAYARAKRGVVILTRLWADELKPHGTAVHAMHPGWVDTPGIEKSLPAFHQRVNRMLRTSQQGADTIVWLANSREAGRCTGLFWLDRRPHETVVFPGTGESRRERQVLWEKLNSLTATYE